MKPKERDDMKIELFNRNDQLLILLLQTFNDKLDRILKQQEKMMASAAELKAELVAANEVTNEIAVDLQDLVSKVGPGTLSAAEAQEVQDALVALKTKLQGVAAVHTPGSPV